MKYYQKSNTYSFSDEEKQEAHDISVIAFCELNYDLHFNKVGGGYRCEEHNSLFVNNDEKTWYWNSKGFGGGDVIAFVQKYANVGYAEALLTILQPVLVENIQYAKAPEQIEEPQERELLLPPKINGKYSHAFAYLAKSRGIDTTIITTLMHKKYIYEDSRHNVVFVGYNKNGLPAYASIRGTNTKKQYRKEAIGSDKSNGFYLKGFDKSVLRVFEAPIDLLSDCTIENINHNSNRAWLNVCRISLGGICGRALDNYIQNNPEVIEIHFMLDNDSAGIEATNKLMNKYYKLGYTVFNDSPTEYKDVNEMLVNKYLNVKAIKSVI